MFFCCSGQGLQPLQQHSGCSPWLWGGGICSILVRFYRGILKGKLQWETVASRNRLRHREWDKKRVSYVTVIVYIVFKFTWETEIAYGDGQGRWVLASRGLFSILRFVVEWEKKKTCRRSSRSWLLDYCYMIFHLKTKNDRGRERFRKSFRCMLFSLVFFEGIEIW